VLGVQCSTGSFFVLTAPVVASVLFTFTFGEFHVHTSVQLRKRPGELLAAQLAWRRSLHGKTVIVRGKFAPTTAEDWASGRVRVRRCPNGWWREVVTNCYRVTPLAGRAFSARAELAGRRWWRGL